MGTISLTRTTPGSTSDANANLNNNWTALENLLNGALDASNLAADSVGSSEIAASAVTTAEILDAAVTLAKLASSSVDSSKIVDGSVGNAELAASAVDNAKVAAGAAIAYAKLALAGSIVNADVAAAAEIVGTKLASAFLDQVGVSGTSTVRRGKSIIATEEARTNVAYGTLTTPDQVTSVVLPTDGLIVVAYQALVKSSVGGAGRAAIFVGANQLSRRASGGLVAVQEALTTGNVYGPLATGPRGLLSPVGGAVSPTSDVTTGQVLGSDDDGTAAGINAALGGPCYVFAAAGTYTVSVQFKATSGSVTAKERKLWVWTLGF